MARRSLKVLSIARPHQETFSTPGKHGDSRDPYQGWGWEPALLSVGPVMQSRYSGEVGNHGTQLVLLSSLLKKKLESKRALS